ncbi:MAG TPA: GTPase HflX [Candidatus Acidoferrales bacterium]|nr:GTPase HflX [Candidatus Acidoferrales bacterium]
MPQKRKLRTPQDGPLRAVLVGVQRPGVSDEEHSSSLAELGRLAKTLGLTVVARVSQKRQALAVAAVIGEGKLKELARLTGGSGVVPTGVPTHRARSADPEPAAADEVVEADARASVVLVDHDIAPSQARNLERATGAEVLDRTAVILAIFQRHARSREAVLQVEIARLTYLAPRLRESGAGKDRQGGGIGGKGAGESHIEIDRRKVRDRIAELRRELAAIEKDAATRRHRRAAQPTVAIVGYTNAGKSSLMRALTGSELLIADQLFATLDTTVRALQPETKPRILVSDTVGFIKKLPHDLVASFRSTLEEAREAALLVHVVDAADPAFPGQIEVTAKVLAEIDSADAPRLLVLNKIDKLEEHRRATLAQAYPQALLLSAKSPADVAGLRERIVEFFEREMIEDELLVPYRRQRLVSEIHASCRVLAEAHDQAGTRLRVRGRPEVVARLRAAL